MTEVVVFGSCMIDFISYVNRMPKPGETLHSTSFETGFGGKGANQCIAASRLGCKTAMIGKVGNDPYGNQYKLHFEAEGVNTKYLEAVGNHSGVALIVVSDDGENQIVINANSNNFLSEGDYLKAEKLLDHSQVLICQLETPLEATVKVLKAFLGCSILNAAPAMKLPDEVLRLPSIFCVNELESQEITGIDIKTLSDVKQSIEKFKSRGCRMVVITLGKLGAAFNDDNGDIIHVSAPSDVKVVDTVGAGDAFIGALSYFICRFPSATWTQKVGGAIEIASHTVTMKGTQTSFVNFPELNPIMKNFNSQVL